MVKNPWVGVREARPDARLRLFCFPFAGGSASAYRSWSTDLPREIEVYPVQLPGREARFTEPAFRRMAELAPVVTDALAPLLDRPFAFYGHSMGAILAFEVAHELRARGLAPPVALFPAAHQAPTIPHQGAVSERADLELMAYVTKMSDTPQLREHPELLRLILPTLRCDLALCDTYTYRPRGRLACAVTALGGIDDTVSRAELDAWGAETDGPFDVALMPGGHFFLPAARELVARTLTTLAR